MPTPLTPSSSQEIIPISPPIASSSKFKLSNSYDASASVTLPKPKTFSPKRELKEKMVEHVSAYDRKVDVQNGKRKAKGSDMDDERERVAKLSRSQVTARMVSPPISADEGGWSFVLIPDLNPQVRGQPNHA